MRGGTASYDKVLGFAALLLSKRVSVSPPDLAREAGCSRATVYRWIDAMQRHFPIEYTRGGGGLPGKVRVRRSANG